MSDFTFLTEWPELQAHAKKAGFVVGFDQLSKLVHQIKLNVIGTKR